MRPQDQSKIHAQLKVAVKEAELFVNKSKEPAHINRFKKFLKHPLKVIDVTLFRLGLSRSDNRRVKMFWNTNIVLPLWDEDALLAYYTGSFGPAETALVKYFVSKVRNGDVFYDIGASLGLYSSLASFLGAEVYAFEPNSLTIPYIKRNLGSSSHVENSALADRNGTVSFFDVSEKGKKSGMASLFEDIVVHTRCSVQKIITVPAVTLDEYCATHTAPTFIKMDVMSADHLVLKGSKQVLMVNSPVLAIRIYNTPDALPRTRESLALLKSLGYLPWKILEDGSLAETSIVPEALSFATTFIFKKKTV